MDRASADRFQNLVADLFHLQGSRYPFRFHLGQADGALVSGQVWRLEHIDVQYVTLDPFAAVHQVAQQADLVADL